PGGVGNGGNISINAATLSLDGARLETSTSGQGNAGNVMVRARDTVSLVNNAGILSTVEPGGVGKGGNISINAATLSLDGARLETSTSGQGNAGNVMVRARDTVSLVNNAGILSTVEPGGVGKGGNIYINAATLSLDGARLEASTSGQGNTIPVDTKLAQGCYSPGSAQNRFVITGRGGLPPNPKDILTPDTPQIDWVSLKPSSNNRSLPPVTSEPTTSTPKRIVEATGATLNAKGQIVLSAKSSTATLNTSRQNPIQCHGS
ncbi:MAG: hypothetical protein V7K34_16015, partial [Nostoc sp.]